MLLRDIGEFDFIDRVSALLATDDRRVIRGIGDDCAVVDLGTGMVQILTTDALVERIHFLTDRTSPRDLGIKALAVNLSDIAAMGAEPEFALLTVAAPPEFDAQYLLDMIEGMKSLADRFGVQIIGGDMTQSEERLMLSVTVLGRMQADRVRYRHGARCGDAVLVAGTLGESGAGLATMLRSIDLPEATVETLRARHLAPEPLVREGRWLAERDSVTAMMDVSDGIASDIRHICNASARDSGLTIGARIVESSLPVTVHLSRFLDATGEEPVRYLLQAGEDYALLICVKADDAEPLMADFRAVFDTPVSHIGDITGEGETVLVRTDGTEWPLTGGHDHFASHSTE